MKDPMGLQFSVFNGHVNDADSRARSLMGKIAPESLKRVEEIEQERAGIMGIFEVPVDNDLMMYAAIVAAYVNEKVAEPPAVQP